MPSIAAAGSPAGTNTSARVSSSRAIRATARPWLPSVAVTSGGTGRSISSGGRTGPSPDSARQIAHEAPRILKAGSPNRDDSSLTNTRPAPSSAASAGSSTSGVGA